MSTYTVHQGRHYRATISLNWAEQFATNDMIAQRLRDAGFTEVSVTGGGHFRQAMALWAHKDATAQIPSQISSIQELEV
jgi:hypothetical protein